MSPPTTAAATAGLPKTAADIIAWLDARAIQHVKVAVTDTDGVLRGKYLHVDKLKSVLKGGFGFCDVVFGWDCADACYENLPHEKAGFTGWHTGYPDAHARLDPSTFRLIPWEDDMPFLLGEFVTADGDPLPVCPRQVLRRVIDRAAGLGFDAKFGLEFEWFNFKETPQSLADKGGVNPTPITPGMFGYSVLRSSQNHAYFHAILDQLGRFDVPIEGLHTETGPGVFEVALINSDTLSAADNAVLFKSGLKEVAHRHGIMPTFMAKWNAALPGSSGHMHQSLWRDGEPVFHDADDAHHMSPIFKSFLAGQLALLPQILALLAPTVNSFKRLVDGMWAPTMVTWGIDNRTVALRVIGNSSSSTRVETRVGGADINPYLAIAASLGAGLWGIEQGLTLDQPPVVGNGYAVKDAVKLPGDLRAAAAEFAGSDVCKDLFGAEFVEHFARSREWEARQYAAAVTDWELRRYFEII
ncbi:MAG: glutamine synthetase [Bradymonadia bacterium]|jgi:glutamine synthetase